MKALKVKSGCTLICLAVLAVLVVACGGVEDAYDDAQLSTAAQPLIDAYACKALEPGSGSSWILTGQTEAAARQKASDYCYRKTGDLCVVQRCWATTPDPETIDIFGDWGCIAQEILDVGFTGARSYVKTGSDMRAARAAAIAYCEQKSARDCMILKCFPAN